MNIEKHYAKEPEKKPELLTIKKTALSIGVQYRQLLNCVRNGTIPHYKLGNSRILLSVSEVLSIMKTKNDGGAI